MHQHLPAILKCLYCGNAGLRLTEDAQLETPNGIETVQVGAAVCPRCGMRYPVKDGIINFLPRFSFNPSPLHLANQLKITAWGYERFWRPKALSMLSGREWPPQEELDTIIAMLGANGFRRAGHEVATHNSIAFLLDQGCSTCFYGRAIIRAVTAGKLNMGGAPAHVVGVDSSWEMLQEARGFIAREGLTGYISLIRADVAQLPFIDSAFTGIASGASLNEFKRTELALQEACRVLDGQGNAAFMVQVLARSKAGRTLDRIISIASGIKFFELDQLKELYSQAGFRQHAQLAEGLVTITHLRKK